MEKIFKDYIRYDFSMRAFLLVIMYTLATALSAQRLVVYSMLGDIQDVTNSAHKPVKLRDSLTPNMVLHIPAVKGFPVVIIRL